MLEMQKLTTKNGGGGQKMKILPLLEEEEILRGGSKSNVSVDADLNQMMAIGRGEDDGRKRVPDSKGHRDKRFGESVGCILVSLTSKGCWAFENTKRALEEIVYFN